MIYRSWLRDMLCYTASREYDAAPGWEHYGDSARNGFKYFDRKKW